MLELILLCVFAMILKDAVAIFSVIAEAKGNERLAGYLGPFGTIGSVLFYSVGATNLLHGHGLAGYLGLIPVLAVDVFDGRYFTAVGRHIQSDENADDADIRGLWNGCVIVAKDWISAFRKWLSRHARG